MVSPILLKGKLFLQKLWNTSLEWNDKILENLLMEWKNLITYLGILDTNKICFPRLVVHNKCKDTKYFLICFIDASKDAYAATVYLKSVNSICSQSNLVFAKTRLAPIKPITLPRFELLALFIGHKILCFVEKELDLNFEK